MNCLETKIEKCFVVVVVALLLSGCAHSSLQVIVIDPDANQDKSKWVTPSHFGSAISEVRSYDFDSSDIVPDQFVANPNESLAGITISNGASEVMEFDGNEESGKFEFSIKHSDYPPVQFIADYGNFAAYALDINQDGIDEVFVEHGRGRGTSVYERYLSIYEFNRAAGFRLVKKIQLSGWDEGEDGLPIGWFKLYSFKQAEDGFAIRLEHPPKE